MDYFKIFIITDKKSFRDYCKSKFSYDTSFISVEDTDTEIHLVPYTIPYNLVKRYVSEYMEQEYVTYINPNGIWEELTNIIFDENDIKELLNINSIMDYEFYKQNKNL